MRLRLVKACEAFALPASHFAVVPPCPVLAHGVASASAPTVLRQQCLGGLARQGAVVMREAGEHRGMLRSSEARRRSTNGQPNGVRQFGSRWAQRRRGARAQEGSLVEKHAVLAPGTVLPPGRLIPGGQLWAGNPARYVRDLTKDEAHARRRADPLTSHFLATSRRVLHRCAYKSTVSAELDIDVWQT